MIYFNTFGLKVFLALKDVIKNLFRKTQLKNFALESFYNFKTERNSFYISIPLVMPTLKIKSTCGSIT